MVNALRKTMISLQKQMQATLDSADPIAHPTAKGDVTESGWSSWMKKYLPSRYSVTSGFVIDCNGNLSDQIDIIVYDRIFSSPIFVNGNPVMVPAESVYAVFEVKQDANAEHIKYARNKAASVRRLERTHATIRHVDGKSQTSNKPILAGILTTRTDVEDYPTLVKKYNPTDSSPDELLNFGCSADGHGFLIEDKGTIFLPEENSLVNFLYRLLTKLQLQGSVAAIDYSKYLETMNSDD